MLRLRAARRRPLAVVLSCFLVLVVSMIGWRLSAWADARIESSGVRKPSAAAAVAPGSLAAREPAASDGAPRSHPTAAPPPARFAPAVASEPRGWRQLAAAHGRAVLIYPPSPRALDAGAAAPVVTMLHGMCSDPEATCELARGSATAVGWFVCPTGNASCGDAADWAGSGETKAAFLDQSLAALDQAYGPFVARQGNVLVGFSRGAFVARDVAYARPNRWVGLVLLGAATIPDANRLKANGIRRVVLGAGDYDGSRATMIKAAAVLIRAGLPARFVSLGPIYHALPSDLDRILADALAWVRADGEA